MIEKSLEKLGFSNSEIKIYIYLLKNGRSYANKLSADCGINRTNVYEALDRLVGKGVVSFIVKNKVKWYEAEEGSSLLSVIDEKQEGLMKLRKDISSGLKNLDVRDKSKLEATIFTGKKGLRLIFEEILEHGKPIAILAANSLQLRSFFGPYFLLWHKRRDELDIRQRTIFPKGVKDRIQRRYVRYFSYKLVEDKFDNPTTTIIYGDNCLLIQWSSEPLVIKINNKEIARSHLNYFNMLWDSI